MTNKPVVVFLCLVDFAASAYNACQAVNKVGRIEAHHVVLRKPPYDFPAEVVCPLFKTPPPKQPVHVEGYFAVRRLLSRANLIHCWNNEREGYPKFANLDIPFDKCKSYTFTGTSYRLGHTVTNQNIRNYRNGSRVVVQDPLFLKYADEFPVEFIPHAVDTEKIVPNPDKLPNSIGYYNKKDGEYQNYIQLLKQLLQRNYPEWRMFPGETTAWWDRLQELSKCMFFFQNLSQALGNPGRSTYEAMAMGIPTFTYASPEIFGLTDRLGNLPVRSATVQTFEKVLQDTFNEDYRELTKIARNWVVEHLSYARVGEEYTQLFESLL